MNRLELLAGVIEIFEAFLEEKDITIPNEEKQEAIEDGQEPESICNIYGSDFGDLVYSIDEYLISHGVLDPDDSL